jgi:tetratricopeptide (TPR) repeat protein
MKMKKLRIIFFLVMLPVVCLSQDNFSRKERVAYQDADFAFDQGDYAYALILFEQLYEIDSEFQPLNYKLGACLIEESKDLDRALRLIREAIESGENEALLFYAKALHNQEQFDESIKYLRDYKRLESKNRPEREVDLLIDQAIRAKRMMANPVDVEIKNLGGDINTAFHEYVPVVTPDNNQLYFTSRRPGTTGGEQDPNGEFFEDIYQSKYIDGQWAKAENTGKTVNSELNDATVALSADGTEMIIFRTNKNLTGGDLYITKLKEGAWTEPEKLNSKINSIYQETSACFSPDKKTLYFSSNRPGGYGGKDLYRVKVLPNGEWSLPKNLGPTINTEASEDAPFMDIDGRTLYFSSDGHTSMGGFDMFKSHVSENEVWDTPENLGFPINTVNDDIFLTVDAGGRKGYYSSDKSGGFGRQDLYELDFIYRQETQLVLKSKIVDTSGEPVDATITLIASDESQLQGKYKANGRNGKFILIVNPLTNYKMVVEAPGYHTTTREIYRGFPEEEGKFVFEIERVVITKE